VLVRPNDLRTQHRSCRRISGCAHTETAPHAASRRAANRHPRARCTRTRRAAPQQRRGAAPALRHTPTRNWHDTNPRAAVIPPCRSAGAHAVARRLQRPRTCVSGSTSYASTCSPLSSSAASSPHRMVAGLLLAHATPTRAGCGVWRRLTQAAGLLNAALPTAMACGGTTEEGALADFGRRTDVHTGICIGTGGGASLNLQICAPTQNAPRAAPAPLPVAARVPDAE
jgi:hypothetical protein